MTAALIGYAPGVVCCNDSVRTAHLLPPISRVRCQIDGGNPRLATRGFYVTTMRAAC
jgi:hypothetical protein